MAIMALRISTSPIWRGSRGEKRLEVERSVGGDDVVDPAAGDVYSRETLDAVDDRVCLDDHHTVVEGGGFGDRRGVLGIGAGVEVAVPVGLLGAEQHDVGSQVDEHPGVQLDGGVEGAG